MGVLVAIWRHLVAMLCITTEVRKRAYAAVAQVRQGDRVLGRAGRDGKGPGGVDFIQGSGRINVAG